MGESTSTAASPAMLATTAAAAAATAAAAAETCPPVRSKSSASWTRFEEVHRYRQGSSSGKKIRIIIKQGGGRG